MRTALVTAIADSAQNSSARVLDPPGWTGA